MTAMGATSAYYGGGKSTVLSTAPRIYRGIAPVSSPQEENPFASPPSLTEHRCSARAYWTVVGIAVLGLTVLILFLPGLAILVALVAVPGLIRAGLKLQPKRAQVAASPSMQDQVQVIGLSLLMGIPISLATGIAFLVLCFGGALIGQQLPPWKNDNYNITNMLLVGGTLAVLGGMAVMILMVRWSLDWGVPSQKETHE